ncbi:hypothetical protein ABW19_dt0202124 [Dactylella cylindrospora]|nr:hypothetical protein ABW19_dt0202124 [Dactylella cylindrospora]
MKFTALFTILSIVPLALSGPVPAPAAAPGPAPIPESSSKETLKSMPSLVGIYIPSSAHAPASRDARCKCAVYSRAETMTNATSAAQPLRTA